MNLFKFLLISFLVLACVGLVNAAVITDMSTTITVNDTFSNGTCSDSTACFARPQQWNKIDGSYDITGGELIMDRLTRLYTSSVITYNVTAIMENSGTLTLEARFKFSTADLLGSPTYGLFNPFTPANYANFQTMDDDTITANVHDQGVVCADVANGITVTNYNIYKLVFTGGNVTWYINGDSKCTMFYNATQNLPYYISSYHLAVGGSVTYDYMNYSEPDIPPTIDSVLDTPAPVEVGSDVTFITNWTERNAQGVKMYICKSDALTTNSSCTGGAWCTNTTVFDAVTPSTCSYTALSGDTGSNNYYAFVCDESILCSASTSGTFTVASLNVTITSPANATYMTSNITFDYLAESVESDPYNCTWTINGLNSTTDTVSNNTLDSNPFTEYTPGYYNLSVNCYDGCSNITQSRGLTVDDVNFTLTNGQNSTAYEGINNFYNVTIGINPDIISDVNASLYWNDTQLGYDYERKINPLTYWFNKTFFMPIIVTNNTSINTKWNVTKAYINGTSYVENSSTSAQACQHAWGWDATSYTNDLVEGYINNFSFNITKIGGVHNPVNNTINATFNYNYDNGSPMTATQNTTTKLGYSNNSYPPLITGYNHTYGLNLTFNYSIDHGILGYNSRLDTNSSYNYTQTIYQLWFGNCTNTTIPNILALNFTLYDEANEERLNDSFQAEQINIYYPSGSTRRYAQPQWNLMYNYTVCMYPLFANSTSIYSSIKYAINSSTYDERRYYLVNSTIDNVTTNIGLYNLDGVPITFTVLDETGSEVADAYLDIRKFFASINNYLTIAMAKTSDAGTAGTYLDVKLCTGSTETSYVIDIYNNQSILIKTLPDQSLSDTNCDGVAAETLKITIGAAVYEYWTRHEGLSYSFSLANDSNNINFTSTVSDTLGIVSSITLNCYRVRNIGNLLISTETVTANSATLTCELGNITNDRYILQTIIAYPIIGDTTFTETIESPSITYNFGGDGLLAGFFLLVALAVGYATTPVFSLIALIIGLIIINALSLTLFSLDAIITLIFSLMFIIYIIGRKK